MSLVGRSKTIVVGLGNPLLRDDGVGVYVAQAARKELSHLGVTVADGCLSGFTLLDVLVGYRKAIIVDAVQTGDGKPGQIYQLGLEDMDVSGRTAWTHNVGLAPVLEWAKRLGMDVPEEVVFLAIEVKDVGLGEGCTPEVARTIPQVVKMLSSRIGRLS